MNKKFCINKQVFNHFPELESKRLHFRQMLLQDADDLFAIRTNAKVMEFMDSVMMKTKSDSIKLLESMENSFHDKKGLNWGIREKESDRLIGYIGFWRIDETHCRGEIGYALHPKYWGKGYMRETFSVILPFGFDHLNLHSVEANVNPANKASVALLEHCHFRQEGYFRENFLFNNEFKDSAIYSLLKTDL